jgi:hypothetical protein
MTSLQVMLQARSITRWMRAGGHVISLRKAGVDYYTGCCRACGQGMSVTPGVYLPRNAPVRPCRGSRR